MPCLKYQIFISLEFKIKESFTFHFIGKKQTHEVFKFVLSEGHTILYQYTLPLA